jgi:ketopantoate hydroxymethyltransferase
MVTAYDAPGARMADEAGVDLILVGDSLAMVVLGYDDTLQVTVDDMAHHTAAVARTRPSALVVADLPWMSYHVSVEDTVRNAATLVRAGAGAVKLEGVPDVVAQMITDSVPVPTIGIGAGRRCDGQVLVFHDLLGLQDGIRPKFVRRYAALKADGIEAIAAFAADVRSGAFPGEEETYHLPAATAAALGVGEPAPVLELDDVAGLYGGATISR